MYPSPVIKVNEKLYFLKSIVRHEGTLHGGHYKTRLYMGKFWVTCNDNHDLTIDYSDPTDGYLFFYENKKQVNTDFLKALSTFPNQDAPFPCSYCGKEYTVMMSLQTHMVIKHSNSQMLKCPFCDSIMEDRIDKRMPKLTKHLEERHKANFNCKICISLVCELKEMEASISVGHVQILSQSGFCKCIKCLKVEKSNKKLLSHVKEKHNQQIQGIPAANNKTDKDTFSDEKESETQQTNFVIKSSETTTKQNKKMKIKENSDPKMFCENTTAIH